MKRRPLPVAVALTATAALLLTACGSGDDKSGGNDKIAGADSAESTSPTPPNASEDDVKRPSMKLPKDVKEAFEGWTTGDATKDAVLADAGRAQSAVTYAVTQGEPESSALSFYQAGSALAASQDWVKGIVDSGLTYYGSVRYYAPDISVFDKKSAGVSYCADESKAFNKNRKTNKIDRTPASDDSFVLYSTRLEKNSNGVWQTTKLESERGNKTCLR
ncbi:lipoprotein [Streptomyces venetus]|uniref:Lipoprotein n=1 Tax=Streptomyces venetus TaxID=1701086 RepID=A0ABP8FFU8_9ACTN